VEPSRFDELQSFRALRRSGVQALLIAAVMASMAGLSRSDDSHRALQSDSAR